ncbi:MAG: Fic family protein [Candidatus Diapherotrites archaeon]|nr:Fic family protein [Candidatus Diapherotrites archaeon]
MVSKKRKRIRGNEYDYWSLSVRLPNGKVRTAQKMVRDGDDPKTIRVWADAQELKIWRNWASQFYAADSIFTPDQIQKIEEMRIGYKKITRRLTKNQLKDLFDRFTANFTYESNALEGSSLTLKDVAIILFEKNIIKGKDLREIYETVNSRNVVNLILKRKFKVTEKDIIRVHKMLVDKMDVETGYKKIPNWLPGRKIETTMPENVEKEMKSLVEFYQKNKTTTHPLKLAAQIHGKFEKIHPFDDGNGRVGRFLINIMLVNDGYPPLIIRKTQRIHYLKCLEDFDNGYTHNIERFLLEKYKDTYRKFFEIYIKYI